MNVKGGLNECERWSKRMWKVV